jgi:hypothetical protein
MPIPFQGIRFEPQPIVNWGELDVQLATWSTVPKLRREFDTHEEAVCEAALLITMGMAGERAIEIAQVVLL